MLTRCPQCRTVFRVTAGQLKARAGHVRCGRCQTAFNALQMLIDGDEDESLQASPSLPPSLTPASAAQAKPTSLPAGQLTGENITPITTPEASMVVDEAPTSSRHDEQTLDEPKPDTEISIEPPHSEGVSPSAETHIVLSGESLIEPRVEPENELEERREPVFAEPEHTPLPSSQDQPAPENGASRSRINEELVSPPSDALEAFLQEPPPPRRWPWLLGSLLALLALLGQAALAFRIELAVLYPQTKPLLVQLCAWAGCEVSLPRRSELLSIEASNLHPGPAGRLELVANVRNRAPFAQQYPHLEVTLTDAADRAVVRRAFAPAEWLPTEANIEAGFAANSEVAVELSLLAHEITPVGYRLYIFHP